MLLENNTNNLNNPIIDFSLKGTDEKYYSPNDFIDKEVLVIIFMCNHCPYVKAVIKRLVSMQEKYSDKNVQFIGINPNDTEAYPEDSFENMKIFRKEHNMNFPYLIDETQQTARQYDAVCTPDIYVYNKEKLLKYRGRIDDNWQNENKVTRNELDEAIINILHGKDPEQKQNPSMGFSIKWKN